MLQPNKRKEQPTFKIQDKSQDNLLAFSIQNFQKLYLVEMVIELAVKWKQHMSWAIKVWDFMSLKEEVKERRTSLIRNSVWQCWLFFCFCFFDKTLFSSKESGILAIKL
jgi:hypothetical protein